MNRRGFLSILAAVAAGAELDLERALWVPGAKKIFIQPPKKIINPHDGNWHFYEFHGGDPLQQKLFIDGEIIAHGPKALFLLEKYTGTNFVKYNPDTSNVAVSPMGMVIREAPRGLPSLHFDHKKQKQITHIKPSWSIDQKQITHTKPSWSIDNIAIGEL